MEAKTLHLTLKKKLFDMILSGEKLEEYREIKHYWKKRLLEDFEWSHYKEFDTITFKNGYASDAPEMIVELKGIQIGMGLKSWGAELGTEYFVLSLGKILSTKNIKDEHTTIL